MLLRKALLTLDVVRPENPHAKIRDGIRRILSSTLASQAMEKSGGISLIRTLKRRKRISDKDPSGLHPMKYRDSVTSIGVNLIILSLYVLALGSILENECTSPENPTMELTVMLVPPTPANDFPKS